MRRRLSRIFLAAFPVLAFLVIAIVLLVGRAPQDRDGLRRTAEVRQDSLLPPDSTAPVTRHRNEDPACLASHLGLPCRE